MSQVAGLMAGGLSKDIPLIIFPNISGRAEMEKIGRKAQELWLSCQSLQNVIRDGKQAKEGEVFTRAEDKLKPLMEDFIAVLEAGDDHPYVSAVLRTVSDVAAEHGIFTEDALMDRFKKVNRVCRRVAMIDEAGGTLFNYFLSYVQSFFIMSSSKPITEEDEIDPSSLTTFSILDNANYYLERGDLEQALRFMNQLRGMPRKVAADWIEEARLLLETRQAAGALLAHASGNGLGSLY